MFSSFMLGGCGLNDWDINSEIVRAVSDEPTGPYKMVERVAGPFAHEPNLVQVRSARTALRSRMMSRLVCRAGCPPAS